MESRRFIIREDNKYKKRFLRRYRNLLIRINRLEEKLAAIDDQLIGLKSTTISDMPRGGTKMTKEDLLIKKEETQIRIQTLVNTSRNVKAEIYECIDHIDDYKIAEVLEEYFIEGKTLEDISEIKHYSIRHVGFLYAKGIEGIEISK